MADVIFEVIDGNEASYNRKERESDTIDGKVTKVPYVALDSDHAPATAITMDSITITVINTEYSKALPTNCKGISFRCVDSTKLNPGSDIRYAFETGKVAALTLPFDMLDGGAVYSENNLDLTGKTLYVAGTTAGDIVLLVMRS